MPVSRAKRERRGEEPLSVKALIVSGAVLAFAAVGCASSSRPAPKAPAWLEKNAEGMKSNLGDPKATISYILGRNPIAIVRGHLVCTQCSGPPPGGAMRGSIAGARYDGGTREETEFTFGHGSRPDIVRTLCRAYGSYCLRGPRPADLADRKALNEGVSYGINRRVVHFSDEESSRRARAILASWRDAIQTRAERWPQYVWHNPGIDETERALTGFARRYEFRVMNVGWHTPKQLAPEIVVRTRHYVELARVTGRILERLLTGYEGYYFEADDERGVPFIYVARARRGPSGTVRYWARSDAVAPWVHG
jgi:hypothetical protein